MSVEVLLSCMNQTDTSIIFKSNLEGEYVLVVNQCSFKDESPMEVYGKHRIINSVTKGLSVSRNLAVNNSVGDICVLADDDEFFVDSLGEKIENAYRDIPDADVIVFDVEGLNCKLPKKMHRLKGLSIYRASSVQISFLRSSIAGKIQFDEKIGSGTKYGRSEDNKFVKDCYINGLKIYYYPMTIARLEKGSRSQWFKTYDAGYFEMDAEVNRYVMGLPLAIVYEVHFLLFKRKLYKNNVSFFDAARAVIRGIKKDTLCRQESNRDGEENEYLS